MLWREFKQYRPGKEWKQCLSGPLITVGKLDDRPVCISVFVHTIDDERIVFYEATSMVVDHQMIDNWFLEHLPDSALKQYNLSQGDRYLNRVDAGNFFNVFGNKAKTE